LVGLHGQHSNTIMDLVRNRINKLLSSLKAIRNAILPHLFLNPKILRHLWNFTWKDSIRKTGNVSQELSSLHPVFYMVCELWLSSKCSYS
jgi:hypothetical protein